MKIMVIQDYLRCGGTEMQSISLAWGFQEMGWGTRLLTFRPGGPLAGIVREKAVGWEWLQRIDTTANWVAPGLGKAIRTFNPDVALLMGREANCQGFAIKKDFPDLMVAGTVRTGRKLPVRYKKSLEACDFVIANSQWAAERISQCGIDLRNLPKIIPNGLVHKFDYNSKTKLRMLARKQMGAGNETTVLLLCAAYRKGKNHFQLLEILNRLAGDWELWLAGAGPLKKQFLKGLKNSGFRDKVKDAGQIFELSGLYSGADIGILPSLEESLSNFLVECQCWGLPVVAYDCGGNKETFEDGKSGSLVPLGKGIAFRNILGKLLANPAQRIQMGNSGAKFARQKFNFESRLEDYIQLFKPSSPSPKEA